MLRGWTQYSTFNLIVHNAQFDGLYVVMEYMFTNQ